MASGNISSPARETSAGAGEATSPGASRRSWPVRRGTHGYDHKSDVGCERKGATVGVLQRFERRLEGMVGLAFARIFKGKVHPAEIAKALQREADEQRNVLGEGRVLAPNLYVVRLGQVDYDNLAEWSDQLAAELADMVTEHIAGEGYQTFGDVQVTLEQDDDLTTGVFEVSSHVADKARPPSREAPVNGFPSAAHPALPPLPPIRGRVATHTGPQSPSVSRRAGPRGQHVLA